MISGIIQIPTLTAYCQSHLVIISHLGSKNYMPVRRLEFGGGVLAGVLIWVSGGGMASA